MSRRRKTLSPSLFPFLAVLVCTLGTLILLLALVAQNATAMAEQNAKEKQQVAQAKLEAAEVVPTRLKAESVDELIAEEKFRVNQLVAFRAKQSADLEDRRDTLTHLDDHIQRLREQLKRLNDEVERAMDDTQADDIEEETLIALRKQIQQKRVELETLRSDVTSETPRVVIVPHKGPNGTDRRPIYLECTAEGVIIRPEGTLITVDQLENSIRSANPLDAALRVIRLHAMKTYGDTTPPYPLLVVRPDGIETYGAAQKAMQDWDDQFGYELVPSDVELAYSSPDANLKTRIDDAVREKSLRQLAILRRAQGAGGTGGFDGLGSASGFQTSRSRKTRNRFPTLSAAELDRSGRSNGFRSHTGDYSLPRSSPYTRQHNPSRSSTNRYGNSTSSPNADPSLPFKEWENDMRAAARQLQSSGDQAITDGSTAETRLSETTTNNQQPTDSKLSADTGDQHAGEPNDTKFELGTESTKLNLQQQTRDSRSGSFDSHRDAVSANQTANHRGNAGGSRSSGAQSMSSTPRQSGPTSASTEDSANTPPQITFDATPRQQELVRRSGANWAIPPEMSRQNGNTIVRTIRVECHQDRFVLLPPASGGPTLLFGFTDANINHASLQLATAVRDRIERWGAALPGGSWQPTLDVQVAPGGENRFQQLQSLLRGSGVDVRGRNAE